MVKSEGLLSVDLIDDFIRLFMKRFGKITIKFIIGVYLIITNIFHENFGFVFDDDIYYLLGFNLTILLLYSLGVMLLYSVVKDIKKKEAENK